MAQEWISIAEASERIDRSAATIRRWARDGVIQAQRSGGVWLVRSDEVDQVAAGHYPTSRIATLSDDPLSTLKQAWGRLLNDVIRDDLPDIIDYQDFATLSPEELPALASSLADGTYQPKTIVSLEMPKDSIRSRPLTQLAIEDRLVYEAAVQSIARSIDSQLSTSVYSHRLLPNPTPTKFVKYFGTAFAQFDAYYPSEDFEGVCLKTDLTSFYEYIDYDQLLDSLDVQDSQRPVLILLKRLFRHWASQSRVIGLPQGSNGSGILANAYLLETDTAALSFASGYARFSDDMRIFFLSPKEARRFAPNLVRSLRSVGLNLAPTKTEIVPVSDMRLDKRATRRSLAQYNIDIQLTSSVAELRAIFDSAVSDPNKIDTSDLNFSLWRLGLLEDDYPLSRVIELLPRLAFAANIVADYLLRVGYREEAAKAVCDYLLSEDSVHAWTNLHLLRLVGRFDSVPDRLVNRLRSLAEQEVGILGDFAARVLGEVGTQSDFLRLRLISFKMDASPPRRRAALLGAACISSDRENKWCEPLADSSQPPQVRRAARFILSGHTVPPTLTQRRTPEWVEPLRRAAEEEGILKPRAFSVL